MQDYLDHWYESADGLRLYARDYQNPRAPVTVLCLHGLTRNSADFAELAEHLSGRYRVIVPDQRGRGLSQWDGDLARYNPATYAQDMWTLLASLGIARVAVIGTSMGGLMAMIMAAGQPDNLLGVALNDIGPEVDPKGLTRIKNYVGQLPTVRSWDDAVAQARMLNAEVFPNYDDAQWRRFARKLYRDNAGVPVLDYDPAIGAAIQAGEQNAVPPDLWPLFEATKPLPTLLLRGAHSDILSADCFAAMQGRHPRARAVTIDHRGHAPMLDEPQALAAIDEFLADLIY